VWIEAFSAGAIVGLTALTDIPHQGRCPGGGCPLWRPRVAELERVLTGSFLAAAELVGTYER
jgi:hypothetical protein